MGKLILVPTPVGNLGDITLRAIDTLKAVDAILAEDTRKTGILLRHFNITNKLIPYHQHNEHKVLASLITLLKDGSLLALVSDAGTPGVSDPGFLLVRECIRMGIDVEVLPGPTAFLPALVASGIPCERFCFEGFLPSKKGRRQRLEALAEERRTMIFYESPHRLTKTLESFRELFGDDRYACVSREISKIHEEHVRGTLRELCEHFSQKKNKGEITVIVSGFVV